MQERGRNGSGEQRPSVAALSSGALALLVLLFVVHKTVAFLLVLLRFFAALPPPLLLTVVVLIAATQIHSFLQRRTRTPIRLIDLPSSFSSSSSASRDARATLSLGRFGLLGKVLDARRSYVEGDGVNARPGCAGQALSFLVKFCCKNKKRWKQEVTNFEVMISGECELVPTTKMIVDEEGGAACHVSYMARKAGRYSISVLVDGQHVRKSPFQVVVAAGEMDPQHSTVKGSALGPLPLEAGESTFLELQPRDRFGNPHSSGGGLRGTFTLKMRGRREEGKPPNKPVAISLSVATIDNGNGTYLLHFVPPRSGLWNALLSYDDKPLQNGSWQILVLSHAQLEQVNENVNNKRATFKALLDRSTVYIMLTQRQFIITSYFLGIVPKRLYTLRASPNLQIKISEKDLTTFQLEVEPSRWITIASKERNLMYGTYLSFIYRNLGLSGGAFEDKREFLYAELRKLHSDSQFFRRTTKITIDRQNLLESSYTALCKLSVEEWRRSFHITFSGELGCDMGGLSREFFMILAREFFGKKENGLFGPLSSDSSSGPVHPLPPPPPPASSCSSSSSSSSSSSPSKGKDKVALIETTSNESTSTKRLSDSWNLFDLMSWKNGSANENEKKSSEDDEDRLLDYFRVAGLFLAKCIYDTAVDTPHLINIHFTKSFYKQLLGLNVHWKDFETDDKQLYTSKIKYILEHSFADENSGLQDLGLTFTEETFHPDGSGQVLPIAELKPGGAQIPVDDSNKVEYLYLLSHYRLRTIVSQRMLRFQEGFHSLLPQDLLSILDESELELLCCGLPSLSLSDWKRHTVVSSTFASSSPSLPDEVIRWFWLAVDNFTEEERARLLQFVTGSSQLPLGGFKALQPRFTLAKSFAGSPNSLPLARTCFHRLELPPYESYEVLVERLLYAINEAAEGFGLV